MRALNMLMKVADDSDNNPYVTGGRFSEVGTGIALGGLGAYLGKGAIPEHNKLKKLKGSKDEKLIKEIKQTRNVRALAGAGGLLAGGALLANAIKGDDGKRDDNYYLNSRGHDALGGAALLGSAGVMTASTFKPLEIGDTSKGFGKYMKYGQRGLAGAMGLGGLAMLKSSLTNKDNNQK